MKKIYFTILLIVFAVSFAAAQMPYAIIKGHVFKDDTRSPVAGQTMIISVDSLNSTGYHNKVVTNDAGFYTDSIKFAPGSANIAITVSTYGCNGSLITSTAFSYLNSLDVTLDFLICSDQAKECVAKFKTQSVSNDMLSLYFMDSSHSSNGADLFKYFWDFGDGTTSTDQSLLHTFKKTGMYKVCLHIVSSNDSLCRSSYCTSVYVGYPDSSACSNYFIYYSDSTKKEYVFEGLGMNGQADTWMWDFGDGTTATGQKVTHSFVSLNTGVTVCLTTTGAKTDGTICISKSCQQIIIDVPSTCESNFWYQPDFVSGADCVFEGYAKNTQISSWKWDFGDGTTATGQKVSHSFANTSTNHIVCLTTTGVDANGATCTHSICQDVYVYVPSPCESSFSFTTDSTGSGYTFEGYTKNNQINNWMWDFGDGTTATGQKVTHSFINDINVPFEHYVCLTTTGIGADSVSCTFNSCQDVYINKPSPCESSFGYQADSSGNGYTFTGLTYSNQINLWMWDFGDGTTGSGQTVVHYFNNVNSNPFVCLTTSAISSGGDTCAFKSCKVVYNHPSPCENNFTASTEDGSLYSFSGIMNSGAQANYYWDFGDGTSASGQQVTHTLKKEVYAYDVCLTTTISVPGDTGYIDCISISCQRIYPGNSNQLCEAHIHFISEQSGFTYTFMNYSYGKYDIISWDFGDGYTANTGNAQHTFSSRGIYTVCLTIGDSLSSCHDQICQEIGVDTIQPGCKASFILLPSDSPPNTQTECMFLNTSAPGYTFQKWKFGDGSESTEFSPLHTYTYPGDFYACLYIWDSLGKCESEYCKEFIVGKVINDNTVSGIITAGNKVADKGIVWLISPDNNYNDELIIDSTGIYHFTGVPYGKYYIYAMLSPGATEFFAYMPTYYGNSLSWQGATIINAGEPNAWYPIVLISSTYNHQGNAIINGSVNWTDASGSPMSPATNVEIVLYNSEGEPVAYTFSEHDGTYHFNNLPYGEYTLQAEMPGKATQLIPVSLSESSSVINIDFRVNASEVYMLGIDTPNNTKILAGNPYPNPVAEYLYLELNVPVAGTATVEVYDMQGRIIHRELSELANGHNRISIKTGSFVKGVYQLRIKTEGQKPVQRRFIR